MWRVEKVRGGGEKVEGREGEGRGRDVEGREEVRESGVDEPALVQNIANLRMCS